MAEETGAPPQPQAQPERARIYLHSGRYFDVALLQIPHSWELLIQNIIQNRGLLTDQMWVPERTMRAVVRNPGAEGDVTDPTEPSGKVVHLRPVT